MPEIQPMVIDDETAKALSVAIVRLCFRDTCLEDYHSGELNWADVLQDPQAVVVHGAGTTPVSEVRRFTEAESRAFRREAADALYTILLNLRDSDYLAAVVKYGQQGLQQWDAPKADPELQVIPSHRDAHIPKILLGDFISAKLALAIVKMTLDCEEMSALEAGVEPVSTADDPSDLKIVYQGQHVPWQEAGRITEDEMRLLMKRWVDRVYTVLRQLHDTKFLVITLRLGAEVELCEEQPQLIPYLASTRILSYPF
ncbi:hypothetical protein [Microvirga sp. BSC39]|uniref:hypothetical protein n=1 Tax=Microvirga sp. BSC39 TaxID=1549810 RepID=UPI000690D01E|nr:hypothetical protein [Microvirga sp. BSC39]